MDGLALDQWVVVRECLSRAKPAFRFDEHASFAWIPTVTAVSRRRADFITPIPKPKKRTSAPNQKAMVFDEGLGLSTATQAYDPTSIINELRQLVDRWRDLPNPNQWQVTPETALLFV